MQNNRCAVFDENEGLEPNVVALGSRPREEEQVVVVWMPSTGRVKTDGL